MFLLDSSYRAYRPFVRWVPGITNYMPSSCFTSHTVLPDQSLACPRDNSGPAQASIAKFGPKMQKTLVKVPIVLRAIDRDLQGQI